MFVCPKCGKDSMACITRGNLIEGNLIEGNLIEGLGRKPTKEEYEIEVFVSCSNCHRWVSIPQLRIDEYESDFDLNIWEDYTKKD